MNIAIITYQYPPGIGQSGIANYTRRLAHGLADRGHSVHIIAHTDPEDGDEQELSDGNVRVHRIRESALARRFSLFKVFAYRWRIYAKARELHRKYGLDIVECPNSIFQGLLLSVLPRKFPMVMRVHTPMFEIFESSMGRFPLRFRVISFFEKIAVVFSDALVTSTSFYAKKVSAAYRIPESRFTVVPLGIPLPDKSRLNITAGSGPVRVLFVGRLEERKGIRYLLEAVPAVLERCPETIFEFVGKDVGGFQGPFQNSHGDCGGKVRFLGCVSDADLDRHYRECDIFAAPSLSESFGLMFAEAMSWGKPVVACDVCAVRDVVSHGETGILVPPFDSRAIAEALIELIGDADKRVRMGARGRALAEEKFSIDVMAENTETFYKGVVLRRS